jgi:hypothetical protein
VKAILGPEWDRHLEEQLSDALATRKARRIWHWRGHAGSQELSRSWYLIGLSLLRVHTETYFGLAIIGPRSLVEDLSRDVKKSSSEFIAPAT